MAYAHVKDGEVTLSGRLPKTWTKKDGTTVSGFHLLPEEDIKEEGWLPLIEDKPEFDPDTHYLRFSSYEIREDKVIRLYEVIEQPVEELAPYTPSIEDLAKENQLLKAQNKALSEKADFHEDVLTELIITVHS
ncbi:hypothetical protein M3689_07155 [Alkalihalophilus marmarensis]|uniref:Uncharacterized protein n=1 Tax=Alkalihalophilus marmarensis DSM 21297 TaxID=1188261 RepID=U6SPM2_9BACI|nr:hypothetical protein [Alkalihalophilus marmarensis]ERN52820.1 hypothetical protein A33I_14080 [Alkalihalophilus marmarensis DSM 21297]MCM3489071.1 hypothetical protein [Alkalihalophilus marmarensis]